MSPGFRRLLLIGFGSGHQPIKVEGRGLTIVLNASISNIRELRPKLRGRFPTKRRPVRVVLRRPLAFGNLPATGPSISGVVLLPPATLLDIGPDRAKSLSLFRQAPKRLVCHGVLSCNARTVLVRRDLSGFGDHGRAMWATVVLTGWRGTVKPT